MSQQPGASAPEFAFDFALAGPGSSGFGGTATLVAPPEIPADAEAERPVSRWRESRTQIAVMAGQGLAGVGNLLFSLVAARLLDPRAFSELAAFLALYLVIALPSNGLSALTALAPRGSGHAARVASGIGLSAGLVIAAASLPLSALLGIPVVLVICLGLACVVTPLLSLARGRLYAYERHGGVVASLVTEPAVRLTLGVALAGLLGAGAAGFGVVAAGMASFEVARKLTRSRPAHARSRPEASERSGASLGVLATVMFLVLGIAQNLSLLMSNRLLGAAAPSFAALSTLGGIVAFATATIPLVFLPKAGRDKGALMVALGIAGVAGLGGILVVTPDPSLVVRVLVGGRYVGMAPHLTLYFTAMAFLGLARVLVVHNLAVGRGRPALTLSAAAIVGQAIVILLVPRTVGAVTDVTALTMVVLAVAQAAVALSGGRLHGIQAPAIHTPGIQTPAIQTPGIQVRGTQVPGIELPGIQEPGVWEPGTETPGTGAPGTQWLRHPFQRARQAGVDAARDARAWIVTPVGRVLTAAIVFGLAVRLYIPRGFWLDEATSIFEARLPYGRMISQLYNHDVHPPLYFSLLWVDIRVFGSGQLGVRAVSVLFGLLVIPMAYVTGRDLFDRRSGVVAAILSVVSPLMVWYSQEARMYSMFMFFSLTAVWAQSMAMREGKRRYWVVWVLSAAALGWTEYFGLFLVAVQVLVFLVVTYRWRHTDRGRRLLRQELWAGLALVILLTPAVAFAYHQFTINQNAGKGFGGPSQVGTGAAGTATGLSVYTVLANVIWSLVGYQSNATMADLGALWPLGILACLLVLGRRHRGETKLVVVCALGPLALDVLLASRKPTLLDIRYVSSLAPLLVLLAARVITGTTRRALSVMCCSLVAVVMLTAGLVDQQSNGSNPRRYDFQRALTRIASTYHPGDTLVYDPSDLNQVIEYYVPKVHSHPLTSAASEPQQSHALYVLATPSLMNGVGDKVVLGELLKHLRRDDRQVEFFRVPNVEVWEFRQ